MKIKNYSLLQSTFPILFDPKNTKINERKIRIKIERLHKGKKLKINLRFVCGKNNLKGFKLNKSEMKTFFFVIKNNNNNEVDQTGTKQNKIH